jgi:hypothetical protein
MLSERLFPWPAVAQDLGFHAVQVMDFLYYLIGADGTRVATKIEVLPPGDPAGDRERLPL